MSVQNKLQHAAVVFLASFILHSYYKEDGTGFCIINNRKLYADS